MIERFFDIALVGLWILVVGVWSAVALAGLVKVHMDMEQDGGWRWLVLRAVELGVAAVICSAFAAIWLLVEGLVKG